MSNEKLASILISLKRAKGQIEAIEKMIQNQQDTMQTITQINAVRGALASISVQLIKLEVSNCVNCTDLDERVGKFEKMVEELLKRI